MIHVIVCFFVETEFQKQCLLNCLNSVSNLISESRCESLQIKLHLSGYFQNNRNWLQIQNMYGTISWIEIIPFFENHGKSKILNRLITTEIASNEWIFYLDGDIDVSPLNRTVFSKLINSYSKIELQHKIGLIALNQIEDCRHNPAVFAESNQVVCLSGIHSYVFPVSPDWLAYGCFFCSSNIFTKTNLQFENVGCYGPEDTLLVNKLFKIFERRSVLSLDDKVIHPFKIRN